MNLSLSDTAYSHIGNLLKEHDKKYVRLQVKGGGCAGFEYEWTFEDEPDTDDHVIDNRLLVHRTNENSQVAKVKKVLGPRAQRVIYFVEVGRN